MGYYKTNFKEVLLGFSVFFILLLVSHILVNFFGEEPKSYNDYFIECVQKTVDRDEPLYIMDCEREAMARLGGSCSDR